MKKKHARRKLTQEQVDSINRKRDTIDGTEQSFEFPKERIVIGPDGRGTKMPHYPDPVKYSEEGKRDLRRAVREQWPQIVEAVKKLEGATIVDGHIVQQGYQFDSPEFQKKAKRALRKRKADLKKANEFLALLQRLLAEK